MATQKSV